MPSPTFTLVQFYESPALPLAHFDLYRLSRAEEAYEIGLDEALEDGAVVIEWPERLEGRLPSDQLDIDLSIIGPASGESRLACVTPYGRWQGRSIEF